MQRPFYKTKIPLHIYCFWRPFSR